MKRLSAWAAGLAILAVPALVLRSETSAIAPTPPLGWNSWDSYGLTVTEQEFQQNAAVMAKELRPHGWEFATVDEGWYLQNPEAKAGSFHFTMDATGRFAPAPNRFPSAAGGAGFTRLAEWTHQRRMKFGIHIIRGIPREAVEQNLPIAGTKFRAQEAANRADTCAWNPDNFGVKANAAGKAYYDSLAALYAQWGVDLVKIDCISSPYLEDEIRMFSAALRKTWRPIVLSLSPGPTPIDKAGEVRQQANMWRISGDIWDHWQQLPKQDWTQGLLAQFPVAAQWAPHAEADHWPDADMLPLGYLGPRPGYGKPRQSNFNAEEARTLVTLWALMRSPLIMGGNLTRVDDQTRSLLDNDEVLAVDQHSKNAHQVSSGAGKVVWVSQSDRENGVYIGLFNLAESAQRIELPLQGIGMGAASFKVRNAWDHKDLGSRDRIEITLQPHASALLAAQP